jgi:hypothetical protein
MDQTGDNPPPTVTQTSRNRHARPNPRITGPGDNFHSLRFRDRKSGYCRCDSPDGFCSDYAPGAVPGTRSGTLACMYRPCPDLRRDDFIPVSARRGTGATEAALQELCEFIAQRAISIETALAIAAGGRGERIGDFPIFNVSG